MADPELRLRLLRRQITLAETARRGGRHPPAPRLPATENQILCFKFLDLVALHLNIDRNTCTLSPIEEWRHGSFNFCIPINVNWKGRTRVILRVPLPYKVGESRYPGNIDEKLRLLPSIQ